MSNMMYTLDFGVQKWHFPYILEDGNLIVNKLFFYVMFSVLFCISINNVSIQVLDIIKIKKKLDCIYWNLILINIFSLIVSTMVECLEHKFPDLKNKNYRDKILFLALWTSKNMIPIFSGNISLKVQESVILDCISNIYSLFWNFE